MLLTEWNEFQSLDLKRLAGQMVRPRMVDLRNIYETAAVRAGGFEAYVAVGRGMHRIGGLAGSVKVAE